MPFCKQAEVGDIFQGSHGKSYCILKLVIFGEEVVMWVLIPMCVNCFDIQSHQLWCADTTTVAEGAKPNANGWHQEFDCCIQQMFGTQEVQFTSFNSQGGGHGSTDKWWAGICSEADEDGITQEDN